MRSDALFSQLSSYSADAEGEESGRNVERERESDK